MSEEAIKPGDVVGFWRSIGPKGWFEKIQAVHDDAAAGKLSAWENSAEGALALLLLLDQFPRNMFRGDKRAFATDAQARAVASRAILNGFDAHFRTCAAFSICRSSIRKISPIRSAASPSTKPLTTPMV